MTHINNNHQQDTFSRMHRLDPRTKILALVILTFSIFSISTFTDLLIHGALIVVITLLAHISLLELARSCKHFLGIIIAVGICNMIFIQQGEVLVSLGFFTLTRGGIALSCLYSLRILCALTLGAVLIRTTSTVQICNAFEAFLTPLARIGLPAREIAMVFSLMLRFIPLIAFEATSLSEAQLIRGARCQKNTLKSQFHIMSSTLTALLAKTYQHAQGLSQALDARNYRAGAARTQWHPLHFAQLDIQCAVFLIVFISLRIACIFMNIFPL